jgi:hypothetical protein
MGHQTRPGQRAGGGFAISGGARLMTVSPFASLGRGLYQPRECVSSRHFREQAELRGFTDADLAVVLREGIWQPDEERPECWSIQAGRWAVVVRIEDETPILITMKFRAEHTRIAA